MGTTMSLCRTCRQRPTHARGACRPCYLAHKLSVHRGDTTWRQLEASGLTLPDGRGSSMGGVGSGAPRSLARRAKARRLRARGLSLAQVGRLMGCTRQAVLSLLTPSRARPRPPQRCTGCRDSLGPASGGQDRAPALCLPCLAKRPRARFAQRLRAHRLAAGLTRATLARKSGVRCETVTRLECGKRPRQRTVERLAEALGVGAEAFNAAVKARA